MSNRSAIGLLLVAVVLVGPMACAGSTTAGATAMAKPATQSMPQAAEAPKQVAQKSELSNTLKWQTASEVDNFGFDVYRSDLEEGPFVRLTESPIPGSGTSDVPTKYEFSDTSIEPNKAYYYYVESISIEGVRERFTPVFRSKPKTLAKAEEADDEG